MEYERMTESKRRFRILNASNGRGRTGRITQSIGIVMAIAFMALGGGPRAFAIPGDIPATIIPALGAFDLGFLCDLEYTADATTTVAPCHVRDLTEPTIELQDKGMAVFTSSADITIVPNGEAIGALESDTPLRTTFFSQLVCGEKLDVTGSPVANGQFCIFSASTMGPRNLSKPGRYDHLEIAECDPASCVADTERPNKTAFDPSVDESTVADFSADVEGPPLSVEPIEWLASLTIQDFGKAKSIDIRLGSGVGTTPVYPFALAENVRIAAPVEYFFGDNTPPLWGCCGYTGSTR
jgi:hypothetical protein